MLRRKVAQIRATTIGKNGIPGGPKSLGVPGQINQLEPINNKTSQLSAYSDTRSETERSYQQENKPTIGGRLKELFQARVH